MQVDECIDVQYSRAKETKLRAGLTIFMILYWIFFLSNACFYVLQVQGDLRVWLVLVCCVWFSVAWVQVILLELQFSYTAFSIYFRFKAINKILNFTAKDLPSLHEQKAMRSDTLNVLMIRAVPGDVQSEAIRPIVRKSATGETCLAMPFSDVVHRIATLHNLLSDVAHHTTTSYRISLVLILMSLLLHLIVTPFYFLKEISERISFNYHYSTIMKFTWSIVHFLRLLMLVEPCYYTVTEGNWSKRLVCRLISVSPTTGTLATRLKLFARQLTLQPAAYSPMGFCTLDRPLVTSVRINMVISGAVIAYLVLLLQFET
ncbi:gustatory receptor for sugar taste 43a-like [Amyelois transitella]|uniref:gustatory receptor for sugar taste 43a-like n=1 Tax=Amyelois transitella TaxID=680683 RepID=UPI00298F6A16|nr:gustatory receptor for sugar taste 43a-like [Amyelois transitella]